MKIITVPFLAACGGLLVPLTAQCEDAFFSDAGIRIGMDAESHIDLVSYEAFGSIDMDWFWDLSENLRLDLYFETAVGILDGEGETAIYARVAPVAELHFGDFPVSVVLSSGPALYSEHVFDDYDIGGSLQFTTGVGVNWDFNDAWAFGYRFQHTSNAHIDSPNPGLDMHTASLSYTF
jgi:hypothetical protein